MRKLTVAEHISLDGVIQHSDDADGFPYSDWTAAYRTPAGRDAVLAAYGKRFDLLLGRHTYDLWAQYWLTSPVVPMADRINAATKYVVTHRPESLVWGPVEALGLDWVEAVRRIRSEDGPDLILAGSSTLAAPLLQAGLVDELLLIVYPVLVGRGKRLFAESAPLQLFALANSLTTPTGVVFNTYRRSEASA